MAQLLFVIKWWFFAQLLGLAALPVCLFIFRNLPDKGYPFSKILGLTGLTYLGWVLASLKIFPFSPQVLFLILLLASVLCWIFFFKNLLKQLRSIYREIWFYELVFLAVFALFTCLRAFNPDIYGTEKFMDFAFLNSSLRAQYFPPADPWLSGGSINFYYYFGYVMIAALTKLTGIPAAVSYNLSIGLLAALIFTGGSSILYNLTKSRLAAGLGGAFLCVIGNLDGLRELLAKGFSLRFDYWQSSRVIPDTINEFPFFSLLHADLHPHLMGLPLTLMVLALCLNIYKTQKAALRKAPGYYVLLWITLSLCIGAVAVTNLFDFPTYALIILITLFLALLRLGKGAGSFYLCGGFFALIMGLALVYFLPFFAQYRSQFRGIGLVNVHTAPKDLLMVFGLFFYCTAAFIFFYFRERSAVTKPSLKFGAVLALLLAGIVFLFHNQSIIWLVILGVCLLWILAREWRDAERGFALLLAFLSVAIITACEIIFIKDTYLSQRMNTIFKFYFQAWVLLSLACGYFVWDNIKNLKSARMTRPGLFWILGLGVLFCVSLVYPFAASYSKCGGFRLRPDLDGSAYMQKYYFGDYGMVRWLKEHAPPDTVILEATGEPYLYFSRISAYTGLPTVLGWANHEWVWRPREGSISVREKDINSIYQGSGISAIRPLIEKYRINYICVGGLERQVYGDIALNNFSGFLNLVYECQDAAIYEVRI